MASIISGATDSFKTELLRAIHDFGTDTFKIALYDSTADLGPSTTVYTTTGEVSGTGYTAGGATLAGVALTTSQGVSMVDWTDPAWAGASFTARAAMIYNATNANRAVIILDFGSNRVFTSASNTITFPTPLATSALIRIGVSR